MRFGDAHDVECNDWQVVRASAGVAGRGPARNAREGAESGAWIHDVSIRIAARGAFGRQHGWQPASKVSITNMRPRCLWHCSQLPGSYSGGSGITSQRGVVEDVRFGAASASACCDLVFDCSWADLCRGAYIPEPTVKKAPGVKQGW